MFPIKFFIFVLYSVGIPVYTKSRKQVGSYLSSMLSGKKLFFPLYFQPYTQGGFSVGHKISREPAPEDVVGVLLSIFFFLKLSLYNVSLGIIPTKL